MNVNMRTLRRAAAAHGATIDSIEERSRHTIVRLTASDGRAVKMQLSRYHVDDHVLKGWARQNLSAAGQSGRR
jgi:hypothetical protein